MEKENNSLKYEILSEQFLEIKGKPKLFRIRALKDLDNKGVKKGDFGGWIECEDNLSQDGSCWISDLAMVYGGACVKGFALVADRATVSGRSTVQDHAEIRGDAVLNNTCAKDCAKVLQSANVISSILLDFASVEGNAEVATSELSENVSVLQDAKVSGSELKGHTTISGHAVIDGCFIYDECEVSEDAELRSSTLRNHVIVGDSAKVITSDLDGTIIVNGNAEVERCSKIIGENIMISYTASLYEDNYVIIGPIAEIPSMIFYHAAGRALCSADYAVFNSPTEVLFAFGDRIRIPFKYFKKLVTTTFNMLEW